MQYLVSKFDLAELYIDNNINENSSGFGESGGDRGRGGSGRWGSLYGVPVRAAAPVRSRRFSSLPSTRDRELGKHTSNYYNYCVIMGNSRTL